MNKIINLFLPFINLICLLIFGNIWNFKRYLKLKNKPNKILLRAYDYHFHRFGAWIGYKSDIADNIIFPHGYYGIFISNDAVIKDNVVIFQHVTIGSNTTDLHLKQGKNISPLIEENCYIGAGAKIIGGCTVGANTRIGANAVVYQNIPSNSVVVLQNMRIIQKENILDNHFYSYQHGELFVYKNGKAEKCT